ncbi:hypothetical protein K788_00015365 [Paraburkholderia caribensis MBA4]|uniref:Uncharacterized protein n=1 Tax=Paraburkholderia caribensis MBA4 TaxID=1323664 RepID=A0A0P0RER7_9BURK|nr:hypothetical protein K788_00015365 [Paraburkholderia caribensis MBA4]
MRAAPTWLNSMIIMFEGAYTHGPQWTADD